MTDASRDSASARGETPVRRGAGSSGNPVLTPEVQRALAEAAAGIDFGSVEVVIHNGKVVQIEARRKRRFDESSSR